MRESGKLEGNFNRQICLHCSFTQKKGAGAACCKADGTMVHGGRPKPSLSSWAYAYRDSTKTQKTGQMEVWILILM